MTYTLYEADGSSFEHGFEVLMKPRDAAQILSVNTRTLSKYAKEGKIRCTWTNGGHRRFPADAVRAAYEGRWEDAAGPQRATDDMHPSDVAVWVSED